MRIDCWVIKSEQNRARKTYLLRYVVIGFDRNTVYALQKFAPFYTLQKLSKFLASDARIEVRVYRPTINEDMYLFRKKMVEKFGNCFHNLSRPSPYWPFPVFTSTVRTAPTHTSQTIASSTDLKATSRAPWGMFRLIVLQRRLLRRQFTADN